MGDRMTRLGQAPTASPIHLGVEVSGLSGRAQAANGGSYLIIGEPGHAAVVADGYGTGCPSCGADNWDDERYDVHFANDVIVAVEPASGRYDFDSDHAAYIVLEA